MRRLTSLVVLCLAFTPAAAHCQSSRVKVADQIFKAGVRVLTGLAAAESMRQAGNASVVHDDAAKHAELARQEYERIRRQRVSKVLRQFESQGLTDSRDTIYSIFLNVDYNASSVYWADTFSNPDIFFVVEAEGVGQFVLPNIRTEYEGGPVLDGVVLSELRPGSRVVVRVLDDDSSRDAVWNSILKSRVNYRFTIDGQLLYATCGLGAEGTVYGGFQLLDGSQSVVIDGPDQIATVTFEVPYTNEKTWVADGELRDSRDRPAGRVQFSQVWNSRVELASVEDELAQEMTESENNKASSFGWILFWSVLGIVFLGWFFSSLLGKDAETGIKNTPQPEIDN